MCPYLQQIIAVSFTSATFVQDFPLFLDGGVGAALRIFSFRLFIKKSKPIGACRSFNYD